MTIAMPAFCTKCENVFSSGFIFGGTSRNITLQGNLASCPKCGGIGIVPDGTYDFIEDTIHILSGPETTLDSLRRLKSILEKAKEEDREPQEVAATIKREIPEQSLIADNLEKEKKDKFRFQITLMVAIVGIVISAVMEAPGFLNDHDTLMKRICSNKEQFIAQVMKQCENQTKETQKKLSSSEKQSKGFQKQSKGSQKKSKGFQKQPKNKSR